MFCSKCGIEIKEGSAFCHKCGNRTYDANAGAPFSGANTSDAADHNTRYDVILTNVGENKMAIIKAVKEASGLGLSESKSLVDKAPCLIMKAVSESEAKLAMQRLVTDGAKAILKFCPTCGGVLSADSRECSACGNEASVILSSTANAEAPSLVTSDATPAATSGGFGNIMKLGRVLFVDLLLLVLFFSELLPIPPVIFIIAGALSLISSVISLKGPLRVSTKIELVAEVALLVVFVVHTAFLGGVDPYVHIVKGGTLNAYPQVTVGEAFDNYLSNPVWESGVSEDGEIFVNVMGEIQYLNEDVDLVVQFRVNEDDETFTYNACEINDLPQNNLIYWGLLEAIYSDSTSSAAT